MPTYDYRCKACGQTFEYFQSMKDDPITTCILCGKSGEVDRLISNGGGIIFKGSGFYVTDYKSSPSKSSESSSGSSGNSSN
ncbi:zinc ribbon domain-containing protein [Leptospira langatensis]|uniref:Zinc ribbon domain-containing protein n=1 Tax=Leptospira langatensis TaxID=2484983 RepID=A0A5F1ZQI0_9LEPT|nr:zinc ribbon domain-containing protein [Leptospira langatensis]TGK05145.1 zinc ribbon domain-containing protein [Leptospira langatensis]TGL38282.1 zinc ribbon domain-containing protein [Leptospira langatensis]